MSPEMARILFMGALLLTLAAFLWLLVTNPEWFFKIYKQQCEENEARSKRVGKSANWLLAMVKMFIK